MSWKKNAFSYLIWFLYTIVTGGILLGVAGAFCTGEGIAAYWGILFAVAVFLGAGILVFFLYRCREKCFSFVSKNHAGLHVLEALLVMGLLAAGMALRIRGMEEAVRTSVYYEAAKVASGQRIPQIVHGAVYLYVHMLRAGFTLLGNNFMAGIWMQIILQFGAFLILFCTVRKLYGSAAALITLGLCTCGSYMAESVLVLSPEFLFFFIFVVFAALAVKLCGGKVLRPVLFLPVCAAAVFCTYLDISGAMLLLLVISAVFCRRTPQAEAGQKRRAVFFCVLGTVIGLFAAVFMDAFLSGKSVGGVVDAWSLLYCPEASWQPINLHFAGSPAEGIVLILLPVFGIFSFWCDRREDQMKVWLAGAGILAAAQCYGVFTEEMPGYPYLYLLFSLAAGIGIAQCFKLPAAGEEQPVPEEEKKADEAELESVILEPVHPAQSRKKTEAEEPEPVELASANSVHGREKTETAELEPVELEPVNPAQSGGKKAGGTVKYIENPLPLPKKHQKRVFDYPAGAVQDGDDFDYPVSEDDDFDI